VNSTLSICFPARLVVGSETLLAFIATNGCFKKRYAQYPFPGYPDVGFGGYLFHCLYGDCFSGKLTEWTQNGVEEFR